MAHETYAITGASSNQRDATRALIICAVIAGGLAFDQLVPFWGQTLTSAGVWLLLWQWVRHAPREEKITLVSCVIYATLGECFLSLAWGLYDYRLGNVPAFVPPGHALLLMLGIILARRLPGWITWAAPALAAPFVLLLAATGADTFGVLLFAMLVICMAFNRSRKLYAVMFVLSLLSSVALAYACLVFPSEHYQAMSFMQKSQVLDKLTIEQGIIRTLRWLEANRWVYETRG